jgi:hypothetical protein
MPKDFRYRCEPHRTGKNNSIGLVVSYPEGGMDNMERPTKDISSNAADGFWIPSASDSSDEDSVSFQST